MRFCHFVLADVYTAAVIDLRFYLGSVICRACLEDAFERAHPAAESFIEGDGSVAVTECIVACNLADHSVGRYKISDLTVSHLDEKVAVCR